MSRSTTTLVTSLFLFLLTFSCNIEPSDVVGDKTPNRYYDLNNFFENEIKRLKQTSPEVVKSVTLNEKTEEQRIEEVDFANELKIFGESHINKVSWWGKYEGDTIYDDASRIRKIEYTTQEEDLKTKTVRISFDADESIDSLFILNRTENPTISTYQELIYIPNVKYKTYSREKVALSKNREITIEGKFK